VCPVRPDTRMACISLGRVVESLIKVCQTDAAALGLRRTVLLSGISVSAQEMWNAVKPRATGKVRFEPDPAIQAIMDGVPNATHSERAARLGLPYSKNIEEIVREYDQAALAHHG
jgi:hypothetical protein